MQVRADVSALRTLFMTLFFASVGMLGDPAWMADHLVLVAGVVGLILVGKAAVVALVAILFGHGLRYATATGICLAQVGEFSFVIAQVGADGGVIGEPMFRLIVSTTLVTLFLTPYLIAAAPRIGHWIERMIGKGRPMSGELADSTSSTAKLGEHVIVIGFGPAGRRAARMVRRRNARALVIDLTPSNVALAESMGLIAQLGDATSRELVEHVNIAAARAVVITLPDHRTVLHVVHGIKALAPDVPIIARARYHRYVREIEQAGAHVVVDEEESIGKRLGREINRCLRRRTGSPPART
jgi:CPA2 family monovalent cation:H+ antiporter-2